MENEAGNRTQRSWRRTSAAGRWKGLSSGHRLSPSRLLLALIGAVLACNAAAQAQTVAPALPGDSSRGASADAHQLVARAGEASTVPTVRLKRTVARPHTALPPRMQLKLLEALPLAVRNVDQVGSCRELFSGLGADGVERLGKTLYYGAPPEVVAGRCSRGAVAATNPGSAVTWLCPMFASLPTRLAALALIHEALHFAGLPERPQVAGAHSSAEINGMVHDSCHL